MKTSQVLKRYEQGKLDFRGENLRGQNFKGKNLTGANFSQADIRGANFAEAILTGANFYQAKGGLPKKWAVSLIGFSWLLAALSGIFSGFAGSFVVLTSESLDITNQIAGWTAIIILILFCIFSYLQGLEGGLGAVVIALMATGVIAVAFAGSLPFSLSMALTFGVTFCLHLVVAIIAAVAGAIAGAAAGAVAGTAAIASMFPFAVVIAFLLAVEEAEVFSFTIFGAGIAAVTVTLLSAYLGWRSIKGDPRDQWIRQIAIAFTSIGGTSFYQADLTDANFTGATLKSTDLRQATLTRTCFHNTLKLEDARLGDSILYEPVVRDLLVNPQFGYKQYYGKLNLRGANLDGANLHRANFKLADLTDATFHGANLEGANLTKVVANHTNFTGANLTGACVEAWKIDEGTQLEQVVCDYVFLLEKTNQYGSRKRRPSNDARSFKPGEFEKLCRPPIEEE
ncbi:pentapeptide repeat-containing protein [Crocosphaera sp. XPORK-15E]|uniref:pentapeptide repeat-containing protein n=1 Tax=Crocosphaera sp. XPORK-15E TaxID=3110247 RepID=UPI002B2109CE|nr:pentapeptide repeat-containing protein [Crocosphaera sp. XPORK-15E]MEA5533872.1 pentapeptide repeat-containing protein [Crocosphaera sp. XPORK-15E]